MLTRKQNSNYLQTPHECQQRNANKIIQIFLRCRFPSATLKNTSTTFGLANTCKQKVSKMLKLKTKYAIAATNNNKCPHRALHKAAVLTPLAQASPDTYCRTCKMAT